MVITTRQFFFLVFCCIFLTVFSAFFSCISCADEGTQGHASVQNFIKREKKNSKLEEKQEVSGNLEKKHPVYLRVYDITNGMAGPLTASFFGIELEGIWHTAIHAYGHEYFYGGGIVKSTPAEVEKNFNLKTKKIEYLGDTPLTQNEFELYLASISNKFTVSTYKLETCNCNHFTEDVSQYLFEKSIPKYILDLPSRIKSTTMGAIIFSLMSGPPDKFFKMLPNKVGQKPNSDATLWNAGGASHTAALEYITMFGFDQSIINENKITITLGALNANAAAVLQKAANNVNNEEYAKMINLTFIDKTIDNAVNKFVNSNMAEKATCRNALRDIENILLSILFHPNDKKYRQITLNETHMKELSSSINAANELLRMAGFVREINNHVSINNNNNNDKVNEVSTSKEKKNADTNASKIFSFFLPQEQDTNDTMQQEKGEEGGEKMYVMPSTPNKLHLTILGRMASKIRATVLADKRLNSLGTKLKEKKEEKKKEKKEEIDEVHEEETEKMPDVPRMLAELEEMLAEGLSQVYSNDNESREDSEAAAPTN